MFKPYSIKLASVIQEKNSNMYVYNIPEYKVHPAEKHVSIPIIYAYMNILYFFLYTSHLQSFILIAKQLTLYSLLIDTPI